jgi:23S rRNA (adenine2030-N6)-methyltransferase
MFSYRHAFHAGNHADVLKHITLLATLQHLQQKEAGLLLVDTHAGAGSYRLDHEHARTSGESALGVMAVWQAAATQAAPDAVAHYLGLLRQHNPTSALLHYPGSPAWLRLRQRPQDRLVLFELHPTDARLLARQVQAWQADDRARPVRLRREDGFAGLRALLPPPSRRALVLIDPSYELKSDYAAVGDCVADALQRFASGCYVVWHPVIGRAQAHALPRRLRALAQRAGRPWLHAQLNVGNLPDPIVKARLARGERIGSRLHASGVLVINPPYTLAGQLRAALPWLCAALRQGPGADWSLHESTAA